MTTPVFSHHRFRPLTTFHQGCKCFPLWCPKWQKLHPYALYSKTSAKHNYDVRKRNKQDIKELNTIFIFSKVHTQSVIMNCEDRFILLLNKHFWSLLLTLRNQLCDEWWAWKSRQRWTAFLRDDKLLLIKWSRKEPLANYNKIERQAFHLALLFSPLFVQMAPGSPGHDRKKTCWKEANKSANKWLILKRTCISNEWRSWNFISEGVGDKQPGRKHFWKTSL